MPAHLLRTRPHRPCATMIGRGLDPGREGKQPTGTGVAGSTSCYVRTVQLPVAYSHEVVPGARVPPTGRLTDCRGPSRNAQQWRPGTRDPKSRDADSGPLPLGTRVRRARNSCRRPSAREPATEIAVRRLIKRSPVPKGVERPAGIRPDVTPAARRCRRSGARSRQCRAYGAGSIPRRRGSTRPHPRA
jgi:hypothetical protein